MTPQEIGVAIGFIISILTFVWRISARLARVELKVDTMWEFTVRRAKAEAVVKGLGELNSPFIIKEEVKKLVPPTLANELRAIYKKYGKDVKDADLMLEIERHFGETIVKEICIPNNIYAGACLLIAVEVAKEQES